MDTDISHTNNPWDSSLFLIKAARPVFQEEKCMDAVVPIAVYRDAWHTTRSRRISSHNKQNQLDFY